MGFFFGIVFVLASVIPRIAAASPMYITFPSGVDWRIQESTHFTALFPRGQEDLAARSLRAAERAHELLAPIYPDGPDHTWLILADWQDSTNGYALNLPYPHIVLYAVPPGANGQLASLGNWLESMILHEYVHIRHIYPAKGLWGVARFIFGAWVLPNALLPQHFHEGMAVQIESELAEGGRNGGTYFEMITRMAVDANVWGTSDFVSRDRMDGVAPLWPGGTSSYYFGGLLHRDLWRRKGADGFRLLTSSYASNWPGFYSGPLREVYGKGHAELWDILFNEERARHRKEIAAIRAKGVTPLKYRTESGFSKWDLVVSPTGKAVAYRESHPEKESAVVVSEVASGRVLRRVQTSHNGAEGFCWETFRRNSYWLIVRPVNENGSGHFSLFLYDVRRDSFRRMELDGRASRHVQKVACRPGLEGFLTYEEIGGKGEVTEYGFAGRLSRGKAKRKWRIPTGTWVTSLLATGDATWIVLRRGARSELYRWGAESEPKLEARVDGHVFYMRRDDKGRLYVIADFDGRSEIWRYFPSNSQFEKQVTLLGGASSFDFAGGTVLLTSYRHGGFDVASATPSPGARKPASKSTIADRPTRAPAAELKPPREYSAWSTLFPRMWVPSFLFVPNGFQVGAWIPGFDVSQRHHYNLFGGYDSRGKPFGDASYTYRFGGDSGVSVGTYFLPSYIQSTRSFFDVWGGSLGISSYWDALGLSWRIGPIYKKVEASVQGPAQRSIGAEISLSKRMWFKSRAESVAPTQGTSISLSHAHYFEELGSDDTHFRTVLTIQQYWEAFWWRNHVLFFNLQVGHTQGTALYNSFFEGGGELLLYQRRTAFLCRGFLPGLFFGRNMATFNAEYLFPIARVNRGPGLSPIFLKEIHGGIVGDVLTFSRGVNHPNDRFYAKLDNFLNLFYFSVGLELKSDWQVFHYLPAQFRVGAYHGFGKFGETLYLNFGLLSSL